MLIERPLHVWTPLIESVPLSMAVGARVWLKMDALQPTGSFKLRGVGLACARAVARGARELVASSGGNAGLAVAWAARALGVPATIVVPVTTPFFMVERMRALAAVVRVEGAEWDDAHAVALALTASRGAAYVPPFDHPDVWDGNASLVAECRVDLGEHGPPGAVVLAVGGGGLLCGVAQGLEAAAWGDVPIVAVETQGAHSLAAAMAADELVALPAITSVAKSLGARQVAAQALEWTRRRPVEAVQVSDAEALSACARFLDDHRVLVEPACGAALAVVYGGHAAALGHSELLVIVCGGAVVRP